MGLGGAQGCLDMALKYSQEREQFSRPIATFQVNAFKLADMATEIECARLLLYKACWLNDNALPYAKEAAMAKLYCSEVMYRAANHAVQLHGGYGLMKEYDIERFYRDQKLLEIGEGTSEVQTACHRQVSRRQMHVESISKMSFGPISLLVPRFQILDIQQYASGLRTKIMGSGGKSRSAAKTRPRRDLEPKSYF